MAAGLVLTGFALAGLRSARYDVAALSQLRRSQVHDAHYRMIELVARGHVRAEWIRLLMGALIAATGAIAAVQQPAYEGRVTISVFATTLVLLVIAGLIALRSGLDHRQRRELEEIARTRTPRYTGET